MDESKKRPANSAMAVELQTCTSELNNARIVAAESAWRTSPQRLAIESKPNAVFVVRFGFGSTRVALPAELSASLLDEARSAPLIVLRGRTDGGQDSLADSRVARERAAAVRDFLIDAGIDPGRIRVTHQPSGDHAAGNESSLGRAVNRRVEAEMYRSTPLVVGVAPPVMERAAHAQR